MIIPNHSSVDKFKSSANPFHRLNMLKILFSKLDVIVDDFEIKSNKKNFSIYTIKYLIEKYKDAKITMIIGEDQLINFSNWYEYDKIIDLVDVVCFNRNLKRNIKNIPNIEKIKDFTFDVSSTQIRKLLDIKDYSKLKNKLHDNVLNYIKENKLYV